MARRKPKKPDRADSSWPHRVAWVLACGALLVICSGGLVTSYNAGMAVPNRAGPGAGSLFSFYPPGDWLAVWDVFLEHGHRLVGAVVAIVAVGLAVVLWLHDGRRWLRWLGAIAVGAVLVEGTLGGLRVLGDEILLAKVHAWIAPLLFALCGALVTVTSPRWLDRAGPKPHPAAQWVQNLAVAGAIGVYLQVVLAAQLRHVSPQGTSDGWFQLWVWLHLIVAGLVAAVLVWLMTLMARRLSDRPMLVRWGWLLVGLFLLQLVLGVTTWVASYGWPRWFVNYFLAIEYTVVAEGRLQTLATTAQVAIGALNLLAASSLVLWSLRLLDRSPSTASRR